MRRRWSPLPVVRGRCSEASSQQAEPAREAWVLARDSRPAGLPEAAGARHTCAAAVVAQHRAAAQAARALVGVGDSRLAAVLGPALARVGSQPACATRERSVASVL